MKYLNTETKKRPEKKLTIQILTLTALLSVLIFALSGAGCLGQNSADKTVVVSGSTSVLPPAQILSEEYMKKNSETIISVKGGGSGTGIAELIDSTNDIAMSSRKIKDTEISNAKAKGIDPVEYIIAKDGISVVINPQNPISTLTLEQLQKIYSGEIRNWKDVGGIDAEIAVIARDSASGTQEFFNEAVMKDVSLRNDLITQSATGAVTQEVSQNARAIGIIGAAYQNTNIKTLSIDAGTGAVMPTEENILSETYPLSRALYLYAPHNLKPEAAEFIEYVMSTEGQRIIREVGYAPIKNI